MNRPGTVLVFALLAVLAMELVALSAFGFARIARLGALHEREHAIVRLAAEDVLSAAVAALDAREVAQHPVGATWPVPVDVGATSMRLTAAASAERLTTDLVLLHVRASPARGAAMRARALLRILPATQVMLGFPAVIATSLPPAPPGTVAAVDTTHCSPDPGLPSSVSAWTSRSWADSLPLGDEVGIGWPDVAALSAAFPPVAADSVRFVFADGDTVIAGPFAGLLIVNGDLRLADGAQVRGLLSVRGTLRVEAGARLEGAARALLLDDAGGTYAYDRCAVGRALATPPFRRVFRTGGRWRLPAF